MLYKVVFLVGYKPVMKKSEKNVLMRGSGNNEIRMIKMPNKANSPTKKALRMISNVKV